MTNAIPVLHIKLGLVNHYWDQLQALCPDIVKWAYENSIIAAPYHDENFEGRECSKVLDKVESLATVVPPSLGNLLACTTDFNSTNI